MCKKNSRLEIGNYRPVSVLPSISKILEKSVHMQIDKYCREHNIFYHLQSGFRSNYSTSTCLIYLHDYIRSEVANGNYVGMVMLDVQKAFDSVNHDMLCKKIELTGIDSQWFRSYFSNRKQKVFVNGVLSSEQVITCGVPQGSILGPWCYLVYCNDMPSCVKCKMIVYADDTILLVSCKNVEQLADTLTEELTNCFHWLTNNRLSMHRGKTEAIVFASKRKQSQTNNFQINHANFVVKASKNVKYLGLVVNSVLSGEEIVSSIVKKATTRLKFLYRHKSLLNEYVRKLLCKSLLLCMFDYALTSWYSSVSKKAKRSLQITQNKIVRFILDLGPRVHVGQNELDRVGILSVNDRFSQLTLHHMFDVFHDTAPSYILKNFEINNSHYVTRSNSHCFKCQIAKGIDKDNFSYIGAREWNNLPVNIKMIPNKQTYKKAVRNFLKTCAHTRETSEFMYY